MNDKEADRIIATALREHPALGLFVAIREMLEYSRDIRVYVLGNDEELDYISLLTISAQLTIAQAVINASKKEK